MKSPRPYQVEAARAGWELAQSSQHPVCVAMATGLGKTWTMVLVAELARDMEERHSVIRRPVLVLVHREELVRQVVHEFALAGWHTFVEQGTSRTAPMAAGSMANMTRTVVVASVQTMQRRRLAKWARDAFCLVLVDECHHAPATTWQVILEHFEAPVVGVTATPGRRGLAEVFKLAYSMPLAKGIEEGYLVPLEGRMYQPDGWDASKLRRPRKGMDISVSELADMVRGNLAGVVEAIVGTAGSRQVLGFFPGVEASKEAAALMVGQGLAACWVAGESEPDERRRAIEFFKGGRVQALCNAAVLTEGFDAPGIEVGAMAWPTNSRVLYEQRLGRLTRPEPGCLAGLDEAPASVRREAIARSGQPYALLMDFHGRGCNIPVMDLVSVLGSERTEAVRERARAELKSRQGNPWDALAKAEADEAQAQSDAAARERYEAEMAARRGEAELERVQAARRTRVEVKYHDGGALPWSNAEAVGKVLARRKIATATDPRPTPAQLADYRRLLKRDGFRPYDVANLERIAREKWSRASMTAELHHLACKHGERHGRRA